jgi:hypothetical protein
MSPQLSSTLVIWLDVLVFSEVCVWSCVWYGERRCEICYLEVRVKLSFFDLVNHNNQDRRKQDDKPFSKPLPLF